MWPGPRGRIITGLRRKPLPIVDQELFEPYVPSLVRDWPSQARGPSHREVPGAMVFVDVSGFTRLSERLARKGKVGAEEVAEVIGSCFSSLLEVAYREDGSLLKFGGDALLLFFPGENHTIRAARAAANMRRALREVGRIETSGRSVRLRMSVGLHSGPFRSYLVGETHRELVIAGPPATRTAEMEQAAGAGEIVVSPEAAAALGEHLLGRARGPGFLLRKTPPDEPRGQEEFGTRNTAELSAFLPAAIRDHLLAGGQEAEHRLVTVAFLHVGGVDGLAAREGPDAVAQALHTLVVRTQAAALEHEVTFLATDIDRDGTKIILAAGAPVARGNDEDRMLLALRAIVVPGGPLPIRAGVNRGHVFAGDIGPPYRRTYTVMGDAVNLAARLLARAEPGRILATEGVVERARTSFDVDQLPPFTVKGKTAPIHAVAVGEIRRETRTTVELPLVGREHELGVVIEAMDEARAGAGRVVELVGEPGIGKSRLVQEVVVQAADATVVAAACEPYGAATPYGAVRDLLRTPLRIPDDAEDETAVDLLRQAVLRRVPRLGPWIPLLGAALHLEVPPTPEMEQLEDRFRRPRLARSVIELLEALLPDPALLVVEDAHWMDEASAELLGLLSEGIAERPWLLCVTRREAGGGFAAQAGPRTTTIRLEPLGAEASGALLTAATEEDPLRPHEVRALADRAGGNPLFLAELLAAARAGGAQTLPDSVEGAIAARIDRLAPVDRGTLRRLSVLGTSFTPDLAEAVLDDLGPGKESWNRLAEFLEREDEGMLRFRHALIRDAAYEGLPFRLRQELHARAAQRIEAAVSPHVEEHAEVLALHFFEARRFGSAWTYARMAARRAAAIYANVEAATFYEKALEAARSLPDVSGESLAAIREALGDVRLRLGEFDRAVGAFRAARRLVARDPVVEARLLLKHALVARRAGRLTQALRWLNRGLRTLEGLPGEEAGVQRVELLAWYGSVRQEQGRSREAIRWCEEAIREAKAHGARSALAHASYVLDWAYMELGRFDEARHSERALAIYEELGDLTQQAGVLNNLGVRAYYRGRWDEAVAYYKRATEVLERTGDAVGAAYGTNNVGEIRSDQGQLDEAETLIRDALRAWRAAGYHSGVAYALALRARVAYRRGRLEEAEGLLQEAGRLAAYAGAAWELRAVEAWSAELALFRGLPNEALARASAGLDRPVGDAAATVLAPLLHRVRGQALALLGRTGEALDALSESLRVAERRRSPYEGALTLRALADFARRVGLPEEQAHALESQSRSLLEPMGVVSVAAASMPLS